MYNTSTCKFLSPCVLQPPSARHVLEHTTTVAATRMPHMGQQHMQLELQVWNDSLGCSAWNWDAPSNNCSRVRVRVSVGVGVGTGGGGGRKVGLLYASHF